MDELKKIYNEKIKPLIDEVVVFFASSKKDVGEEDGKKEMSTVKAMTIAIILAIVIRTWVVQPFKIPSGSMEETLLVGDYLLVNKFSYGLQVPLPKLIGWTTIRIGPVPVFVLPIVDSKVARTWGEIEAGDVVVFRYPGDRTKDYIKRVIGAPGDTVELRNSVIYLNGEKWDDPYGVYKKGHSIDNFAPYTVPEGEMFVMGDNRNNSYDSRFWGTAPVKDIRGKAFIIYWSWNRDKGSVRGDRLFSGIK